MLFFLKFNKSIANTKVRTQHGGADTGEHEDEGDRNNLKRRRGFVQVWQRDVKDVERGRPKAKDGVGAGWLKGRL